jgi:phosphate/sulfate permease
MNINCKEVAERHLLNQNPLYTLSFPLSLLIAIIIFGMAKAYNWSSNSYINQILIPILSFLIVMVILDVISRCMISNDERNKIISECKSWVKNSPSPSNYSIENYIDFLAYKYAQDANEIPQWHKEEVLKRIKLDNKPVDAFDMIDNLDE